MKNQVKIDVGCGNPKQRFNDCIGIDINFNYKPDIVANVEDGLPLKDEIIDFINSDNSLEHVKNPFFVLQEFHRIIRPGGTIRIIVPNGQFFPLLLISFFIDTMKFWNWYMNLPWKRERTIHFVYFTKYLIKTLIEEAGFQIKKTKGFIYSKNIEILAARG